MKMQQQNFLNGYPLSFLSGVILPSTKEFLSVLTDVRKLDITLIETGKGGVEGGGATWMHEDMAIESSRWLSPKFSVWCNDRIKELLRKQQSI